MFKTGISDPTTFCENGASRSSDRVRMANDVHQLSLQKTKAGTN